MSQEGTYRICCPKCGHAQDVELYDSINVASSPELREQLMTNRINTVECAGCGFSFRVDKVLLYNDPEHTIMIHLLPVGDGSYEDGEKQFRDSLDAVNGVLPDQIETPRVHLVFSRSELIEKIFLLEEGMSDRVIEYVKYMIYVRNMEKVNPSEKALLFDAKDSTAEELCFVIQDLATQELEGVLQYSRQAYGALCEMFDRDDETANLLELFPGPYVSARVLLLSEAGAEDGSLRNLPPPPL